MVVCTVLKKSEQEEPQKEVREYPTFRQDLINLAKWLKEMKVELAVMEGTGVYWKCVYEALEDEEITTYLVNACHVKNVPGRKTDVKDSEWLAELARCGLLRASFIPPRDFRELRILTRYRKKLVGYLSGEKNRLHKILDDCGVKLGCIVSDIDGVSAKNMITALIAAKSPEQIAGLALGTLRKKKDKILSSLQGRVSDRHRFLLQQIQKHMEFLQDEIQEIDSQIVAAMKPYQEEWQLLQTIPGIDEMSAAMLLAEIANDMSQFRSQEHLCSWAGICPGNNESAGKKKSAHTRKANKYLKSLLCEIAHCAAKTGSQFKGMYQSFAVRRGSKRAIVAVAHKLLKIIFVMLVKKVPYKDPEINYQELMVKRNAPRWLKSLEKFGYISSN
jgi:transposase